jgi:hypothetical protein
MSILISVLTLMWIIAHSIVTSYHLCKQFGVPKHTGSEWTCSYSKTWWWPNRSETCSLVCTFDGNNRCVRRKYKYCVLTGMCCMQHNNSN